MISVSNVSMRYGAKILFEDVATAFLPGRRYGLTGPNGAGKSTFMKLLSGELEPQKGTVVRPKKLGILRQDQFAFDKFRVVDSVIMGNMPLWKALAEREELYAKAEVDMAKRSLCTVVSCGGKWTIAPIANLLKQFEIPFRIIHDRDKKGRTDAELAEAIPIDPYNANARIAQFVEPANIRVIDDTLEDLFWEERPKSSGDKPYRIWKRVKEIVESEDPLKAEIKDLVQFAFNW